MHDVAVRALRALASRGLEALPSTWSLLRLDRPVARKAETHLFGEVDGYDAIVARFAAALKEGRPVLLWVRSPGGDVLGLEDAARQMMALRAGYSAPVYAIVHADASDAARRLAEAVADRLLLRGERHRRRTHSGELSVVEELAGDDDEPRTA